jgi:hypothetical protein
MEKRATGQIEGFGNEFRAKGPRDTSEIPLMKSRRGESEVRFEVVILVS